MHALFERPGKETFSHENFHAICDELASRENVFNIIIQTHGYPPLWQRKPGFATLIHIILEQQVSLASALAALEKLQAKLSIIEPAALLKLSDADLKACYFSRQKIIYARELARAILDQRLQIDLLPNGSNEEIIQQLVQLKGIGRWTCDVYLMMALHRADCFPVNDIALVKSMKHEWQLPAKADKPELLEMAENWRPYRTIAAYLLWHAYLSRRSK